MPRGQGWLVWVAKRARDFFGDEGYEAVISRNWTPAGVGVAALSILADFIQVFFAAAWIGFCVGAVACVVLSAFILLRVFSMKVCAPLFVGAVLIVTVFGTMLVLQNSANAQERGVIASQIPAIAGLQEWMNPRFDRLETEHEETQNAIEELKALIQNQSGTDPKNVAQLIAQIDALINSSDVEAQEALAKVERGGGFDDIDQLNEKRIAEIEAMAAAASALREKTATSLRAAGAAHFAYGQKGTALQKYIAADRLVSDDFWTVAIISQLHFLVTSDVVGALAIAERLPPLAATSREKSVTKGIFGGFYIEQLKLHRALEAYENVVAIFRTLTADETDHETQRDLLKGLGRLGAVYELQGDLSKALETYEEGLGIARRLAAEKSDHQNQQELADALLRIGNVRRIQKELAEAFEAFQEALGITRRLAADETNAEAQRKLSISLERLGYVYQLQGDLPKALEAYEESLGIARLLAADETNAEAQQGLSVSLDRHGYVYQLQGDLLKAVEAYGESLRIRRLLAADKTNLQAQRDLSVSLNNLGDVYIRQGEFADAFTTHYEALEIARFLVAEEPNAVTETSLYISYAKLGLLMLEQENWNAALEWFERALLIVDSLANSLPDNVQFQQDLKKVQKNIEIIRVLNTEN